MKKFMLLLYGYEKPDRVTMIDWRSWNAFIASCQKDQGTFGSGVEIASGSARPVPTNRETMNGYHIVEAESLEAAQAIASRAPCYASIRIYELR